MKNLKIFFKNLEVEYLRIAETRKTCPHVIKFEKVSNYICLVIIALLVVFGIATSVSAEEPLSVEPRAIVTFSYGLYKLDSDFVTDYTNNSFDIDAEHGFYDLGGDILWELIGYDHVNKNLYFSRGNDIHYVIENGIVVDNSCQYIYFPSPSSTLNQDVYNRFSLAYTFISTSSAQFQRMADTFSFGITDGYNVGYDVGFDDGVISAQPFANIIGDIFKGLDNFVIFADFSILDIIKAIMGIFLAVWLLKLIAGG